MQKIPCAFCFDRAFVEKAAVAITSLCIHAESDYKIYCLVSDTEDDDLDVLRRIARRFHVEIIFIQVDNQFYGWQTQKNISTAAYTRLLIPSNLSEPKAIYLDCDILVTCDLRDLIDVELGDALIGGCRDHRGGKSTKLKLAENDTYVNSGVLLLNLDRLRAEEFQLNIRPVYEKYKSEFISTDQCLINKMTEGRKYVLDRRWNVMAHERPSIQMALRDWCEPFDRNGILHFTGDVKPWHPWSEAWEAGLWQSYARLAGVPGKDADRKPVTVTEWSAVARKAEAEGNWKQAALAHNALADYYRQKTMAHKPTGGEA